MEPAPIWQPNDIHTCAILPGTCMLVALLVSFLSQKRDCPEGRHRLGSGLAGAGCCPQYMYACTPSAPHGGALLGLPVFWIRKLDQKRW